MAQPTALVPSTRVDVVRLCEATSSPLLRRPLRRHLASIEAGRSERDRDV